MAKKKANPGHSFMCKCVAKINAYQNCSSNEDAKAWARALVKHLINEKLISASHPLTPIEK